MAKAVCVIEKWREDPFYGAMAIIKVEGYVVRDFTGGSTGPLETT